MTTLKMKVQKEQIFHSKNVETVHSELENLLPKEMVSANDDRTMLLAGGRLIVGESGVGKTTALNNAVQRLGGNVHALDHTQQKTILVVPALARITLSTLSAQILDKLGLPAPPSRDTAAKRLGRAIDGMKRLGTNVLVIDEAQHLVSQRRNDETYVTADGVKAIMNEGIAVLLVGTKDATKLLDQNEQLRRRMCGAVTLTNWGDNKGQNNAEMVVFVKHFFETHGLERPDCFKTPKFYEAVCCATNMNISYTARLLEGAVRIAQQSGRSKVVKKDIEQSFFDYAQPQSNARNPFSKEFNGSPLFGKGELFFTGGK